MTEQFVWHAHIWGIDPKLDEIVSRRFGSRHERPCLNENMLTCAMPDCQFANCCQYLEREKRKSLKPSEERDG